MKQFQWFAVGVLIIVTLVLLFGCTCDGGFRNMSDEWCDRHELSWDQESLSKAANVVVCPDRNYVFGTDEAGNLKECL